jgi:hypothetical protein
MSVRKILAPLLGGPNDGPTLSAEIAVSGGLEAHLEVRFVCPDPVDAVFAGTARHAMRHTHLPPLKMH